MSQYLEPGTTIKLGGQDYVLPALNQNALEKYWETIQGWAGPPESLVKRLGEVAEVLHAALVRNYPDLTLHEVKEGLDLRNFPDMVEALLSSSGLARTAPGEKQAGRRPTGGKSGPGSPA